MPIKSQVPKRAQSEGNMEIDCAASVRAKKVRARAYAFTWYGATEQDIFKFIRKCEVENWKYILGDEVCPDTNRQHWQGYINFNGSQIAKTTMSKLINGGWSKIAKGDPWSNWEYCGKDQLIKTNIEREEVIPDLVREEERLDLFNIMLRAEIEQWIDWFDGKTGTGEIMYMNCLNRMDRAEKAKLLSIKTKALIVQNDKKLVIEKIVRIYKENLKKNKHGLNKKNIPNLIVLNNDGNTKWLEEVNEGIILGRNETITGSPIRILVLNELSCLDEIQAECEKRLK